ncbi:hypothetical protein Acr_03g0018700 [Actinidia rufa]|uniref:Uncharacterized protein n=1 Tax=Actinidia rufa TaxID=165716 RepID=A0A7J0EFX4_9ERIC|nr:hypothetical protein Acr_03g0018700 [Actinidia rufa]
MVVVPQPQQRHFQPSVKKRGPRMGVQTPDRSRERNKGVVSEKMKKNQAV